MLKRKRRAAPEDIYRHCIHFGTCPPDVKDKIENTTIADKILQYGSIGVFLGGLGIGTGKGTGGGTGYVPLGEGPGIRVGSRPQVPRPYIPPPLDPISIGPREFIPARPIDPLGPSIIPLEELPPSIDIPGSNVEVIAEIHPVSDLPTTRTPTVTTDGDTSAVVEITPHAPPVRTIARTQYNNPLFEVAVTGNHNSGELSAVDHVFVNNTGGNIIGEEIPLLDLSATSPDTTIVEETSFLTSTPSETVPRRVPPYPRRLTVQREVQDPLYLQDVQSLVTFDNPVYNAEDISLIFDTDVAAVEAAPHPDFTDIVRISRPYFDRAGDYVRVGRFGQKASMTTRAGTQIGPVFHFYTDVSSIAPAEEAIELQTFGEHSGTSVIVLDTDLDSVSLTESLLSSVSDQQLLDDYEHFPPHMHLSFGPRGRYTMPLPDLTIERPPFTFFDTGVHVFYPTSDSGTPSILPSDTPMIVITIDTTGPDFDIHPSLLKRRKRVHI